MNNNAIFAALLLLVFSSRATQEINFSIVIPTRNASTACLKTLESLVQQKYPHWHAYVIDDFSTDGLKEQIGSFIQHHSDLKNKVTFVRHDRAYGRLYAIYKTIINLINSIAVVMLPGHRFANMDVLKKVADIYANPVIWAVSGAYKRGADVGRNTFSQQAFTHNKFRTQPQWSVGLPHTFRAELFKKIKLHDLMIQGYFWPAAEEAYMFPILEMASQGHYHYIGEILCIDESLPGPPVESYKKAIRERKPYAPLEKLSDHQDFDKSTTIVVYSKDRPLQLYALLESLYAHVTGTYEVVIIYAISNTVYETGYMNVRTIFSQAVWLKQRSTSEFKQMTLDALYKRRGAYVLFGVDDIIVKDNVSINDCIELLELTGAHGFYLRLGTHITHCYSMRMRTGTPPLMEIRPGVFAWQFGAGRGDWKHANTLDMTLYRKRDIKSALESLEYYLPNELEAWWEGYINGAQVGLCYESTKIVNVPLNLVQAYARGNRHMGYMAADRLLEIFLKGFKMDTKALFKIKNQAPHMEYEPHFVRHS